jgi:hypothetical protein
MAPSPAAANSQRLNLYVLLDAVMRNPVWL